MAVSTPSDVGTQAISHIKDTLQVDEKWSVDKERGFYWWGQNYRQNIWSSPALFENGFELFRIHSETDFIRNIDSYEQNTLSILGLLNRFSSTSALIYDNTNNSIRLHSSMFVHKGTASWVPHTFAMAAIIQPIEAQIMAEGFADVFGGEPDISKHPASGTRREMDDMLNLVEQVYAPEGRKQSVWANSIEFEETAAIFNQSNSFSKADGKGLTAEFAYGEKQTSLMTSVIDDPHPRLGNGVLTLLKLPLFMDKEDANKVAGILNQLEVRSLTRAHLLGAWCSAEESGSSTAIFASFIPNIMYRPGLLTQMLISMAARAQWTASIIEPDVNQDRVIDILMQRYIDAR